MAKPDDPFTKADLISRYLKGDLSYNEQEKLRELVEEDVANRRLLDDLENEDALAKDLNFFSSVNKEIAWEKLTETIDGPSKQHPAHTPKYWRYAAAAVIAGALAFVGFKFSYLDMNSSVARVEQPVLKNDVLPGGNKATLALADGSVMLLEDMANGTVQEENGIRIRKKDGEVVYEAINKEGSKQVFYNTINTPVGGQYRVVLPDGSKVWLNSESSLRFPTAFSGSQRTVDLTGEGYFEIAKNADMPFVVQALKTRVEVLGTHFNLMAYSNEGASRTTLLEGSVKVGNGASNKIIAPGQQAVTGDRIQIRNVDTDEVIAWKNGYFEFENENLETILHQLKRWYDVEVESPEQIPDKHFSAYISRNKTLSQVLKMLELSGDLKFRIEGKKISIQKNQ